MTDKTVLAMLQGLNGAVQANIALGMLAVWPDSEFTVNSPTMGRFTLMPRKSLLKLPVQQGQYAPGLWWTATCDGQTGQGMNPIEAMLDWAYNAGRTREGAE